MQLKNLIYIIVLSSLTGLVFNHFNPKGIYLIKEVKERQWIDSIAVSPTDTISTGESTFTDKKKDITPNEQNLKKLSEDIKEESNKENQGEVKQQIKDFEKPLAISLANAYRLFNEGVKFVDARNREDFLRNHIPNSINIPYYQFEEYSSELNKINKENAFVIYCNGKDCDMSDMLADVLFERGYKKIYLFVGGWEEWEAARYPSSIPYEDN